MSEVKNTLQKHPVLRYSTMLFGMLMTSIGINGFLRPAHLLEELLHAFDTRPPVKQSEVE
ncbi:hypothetical protein TZ54_03105 [Clostridioides difficile]|nr:hypothetical protein [Clostridioides difficile]KJF65073.1 hypothetical protein TZ54_03105 [Clostridioides difficile]